MSGSDEAWKLFDEAFAISNRSDHEDKIVDFSEKIKEIINFMMFFIVILSFSNL